MRALLLCLALLLAACGSPVEPSGSPANDGSPSPSAIPASLVDPDLLFGCGLRDEALARGDSLSDESAAVVVDRLRALDVRILERTYDQVARHHVVTVLDATPGQVDAWAATLEEPARWCLRRAERSGSCDEDRVRRAVERGGERPLVVLDPQDETTWTDGVTEGYLGLTMDEARARAETEQRRIRIGVLEGVGLDTEDDLDPGRLTVTTCGDVVVDVLVER